MPEPDNLTERKMALARATLAARRNTADLDAQAELARAREDYTTALAVRRVHATIDGVPLDLNARRRIIEAVLTP